MRSLDYLLGELVSSAAFTEEIIMQKRLRATAALTGITALVFLASTSANASQTDAPHDSTITTMTIVGFNEAVAAENGFQVVTNDGGEQTSVPVTPAAISLVQESEEAIASLGYDEKRGNCGMSWVGLRRDGRTLDIGTGYEVPLPVRTRHWGVVGFSGDGAFDAPFNAGSGPAKWNSSTWRTVTSGGWGHVAIGSFVELSNGAICYSGNPQTTF